MTRTVGIGHQNFEKLITEDVFYVDKTRFIKEWWENKDDVTLITRPRRFGKTLNLSMMEAFFSVKYANRGDLFENLFICEGSADVKVTMEGLLEGKTLHTRIDEQIVYQQLDNDEEAIWSLLLASGYLCVESYELKEDGE